MASYIEQNLAKDENIICKAQVSWLSQFWYLFFGGLFILSALVGKNLFIFLLGGLFILIAFLNVVTTELAITNRRVIAKFGLIQRQTIELTLVRLLLWELVDQMLRFRILQIQ